MRLKPKIKVEQKDLSSLLLCTFRYALGRRTYIVNECCEWLTEYWDIIPEGWREQIHSDIRHAIEHDMAGDKCDVESWRMILKLPSEFKR